MPGNKIFFRNPVRLIGYTNTPIGPPTDGYFIAPTTGQPVGTTAGNDTTGLGTLAKPWATLTKAQANMRSPGTYKKTYMRGGTYAALTSTFTLTISDNSTTWIAYPGEVPIFTGGTGVTAVSTTGLVQGIIWDGIKFSGFFEVFHLYSLSGTLGWKVQNCILDGQASPAIHLQNSSHIGILNNEILNGTAASINTAGIFSLSTANGTTTDILVQGNYIHDMASPAIAFENNGQNLGVTANLCYDITIDSNNVLRVNNGGLSDSGGIYVANRGYWERDGSGNAINTIVTPMGGIISNNTVTDAGLTASGNTRGIYIDDTGSAWDVYNNTVQGFAQYGIHYHLGANNTVHNNQFDLTHIGTLAYYQGEAIAASERHTGMTGNTFQNNTVIRTGSPPALLWNVSLDVAGGDVKPTVSGNQYWSSAGGAWPNSGASNAPIDSSPSFPASNPWNT